MARRLLVHWLALYAGERAEQEQTHAAYLRQALFQSLEAMDSIMVLAGFAT